VKISLFLSQSLTVNFRNTSIRENKLPLPTIDPTDATLSQDEGTRLTKELAQAWVQALGFAQLATVEIWERATPSSTALAPLAKDPTIREIVSAIPSIGEWREWEARSDSTEIGTEKNPTSTATSTSTTRWTKQGRAVAGPSRA
jgi:hypothetical protein